MEQLFNNPWLSALIVLITQIFFVYFRTLNVIYNSEKKLIPTIITGNIIGICWLITISFGITAVINLQWQPIAAHIIGGTVGVIYGFKTEKYFKNK
jgi:uncharacterized protein YebE (UPF0316 family)